MSRQSSDHMQASAGDGSHRRVQVYPVERNSERTPYDASGRAPGGPQYQWYHARGDPNIQPTTHSDYHAPQHHLSVDSQPQVEVGEDLERVPWQDAHSQTAGAFYTQARTFLPSPPTTIHSPRGHQQHVSGWESQQQARRSSEQGYDSRDANHFNPPRESRRRDVSSVVPAGASFHLNPDHERHGAPMVSRHPSLQTFGPYTTTVLQPGRNPSALTGDHLRSRSPSHIPYSAQQQFLNNPVPHSAETPQYVVPSSRIPRADSTAHISHSGHYDATNSHSPEELSETKPKRRRANAAQLQLLNDTYTRTMFPTTEERADIARRINMTPRQVQIWFQNRRQASRQSQSAEPGIPSGSTIEGAYGEGHSDYSHEPEDD
ncbi:unnamed protein product [Rhizoctonia solani]|uniref:Homeobox domain-containing protein n=1 Tax=Rhizoctonia solani TaxID=456999 RepID=A0A8H3GLT6_9AGAM|nr:unnamed protein product [Rhizoctonia solani]